MARITKKLETLLWKSFIVRKCHWIVTLLELCFPILLFVVLASLNRKAYTTEQAQYYQPQSERDIIRNIETGTIVLYSPKNEFTSALMNLVNETLISHGVLTKEMQSMNSETEMDSQYRNIQKNSSLLPVIGVVFDDVENDKLLKYKIRTPYLQSTELFSAAHSATGPELYKEKGFLGFQIVINKCFMKMKNKELKSSFGIQKFPVPQRKSVDARKEILQFLTLITVLSFIFLCPGVVQRIVEENQSGMKELMKLMGLPSLLLWINWFFHAMSIAIISITAVTIIVGIPFKSGEPLLLCSGIVVWITLFLYCTASIAFLFLTSALFSRPTVALIVDLLLWFVSSVLSSHLIGNISPCCKILSSLFPNFGILWAYQAIFQYEYKDISMTLGDVISPSIGVYDFQLWQVWAVFIIETHLFFILTLYFEAILPGKYGVAKPWYFPFKECFSRCGKIAPISDVKSGGLCETDTYEPLAPSLPVGIKIRNLHRVFKPLWKREAKIAVDGVSLDICKEQITVLLGHNGAGKSTTMMILTGMISPTSGNVHINGYDIKNDMDKVRESLGLCPQQNLLFPDLTVWQHLVFFAKLKGEDNEVEQEVDFYSKKLNLIPHLNKKPQELSGGYKRRLCLALAFIGQSKTIILDEPTSGLDPEARREIWDLLLSMRGDRTILITTHIMEEADVLGDRIAIMDHGRIQCYGTPMYLKNLYGTGYVLSILKKSGCNGDEIEDAVKSVVPGAELKSSVSSLMTFSLPIDRRDCFPRLFSKLQNERVTLGVESVGVSVTTLEEVFLRVGEIALEEYGKNEDCLSEMSDKSECSSHPLSPPNVKGMKLLLLQLEALVVKRMRVMSYGYVIMVLLSILAIILVTVLALHPLGGRPLPQLNLELEMYGKSTVLYGKNNNTSKQLTDIYETIVKQSGSSVHAVGSNLTDTLMEIGVKDRERYTFNYIIATHFNSKPSENIALFSDLAIHSLPISMNLLINALAKNETQDNEYGFAVSNHPFQRYEPVYLDQGLVTVLWMSLIPLVLTFWMCLFLVMPMQERVSSSRQLQRMAGVSLFTYWGTLFLWDMMLHIIFSMCLIISIGLFDRVGVFSTNFEICTLFLIFMLYGVSAIPFSYFVSFWKDTKAGCYCVLVIVNILAGPITEIILQILKIFDPKASNGIQALFRIIPNFSLTEVLEKFVMQVMLEKQCLRVTPSQKNQICSDNGNSTYYRRFNISECPSDKCSPPNPYISPIQDILLYLGLSWILYMGLILILDMNVPQILWEKVNAKLGFCKLLKVPNYGSSKPRINDEIDSEVMNVQKTFDKEVATTGSSDLIVNNLKKKYGILPKPLAVKGVSFRVKPGECFGLLGVNGAGKTTTFKMLTGAVVPTDGVAAIAGYRSDTNRSEYLSQIGYCPQHDALIECQTATEALRFYGALRGIPRDRLNSEVNLWINRMGLREYRNRPCGTYSGGNKRKLMTAIALIGNPPLVFLDEPTSGVDPVARRNLWNSLISLQKAGQSIVLTSHSMEECEALCNRLGIMVDGQLACIGSIPYLKEKYKQGSTVKIKLKSGCDKDCINEVKSKMTESFTNIILKDEHETLLHYQVTDKNISWGFLFETMENFKKDCKGLEDYTISETSLEEVFLSFAQT